MCALIPGCRLSADDMLARVNSVLLDASMDGFLQATEKAEDRRKLKQALGAAEKLARLLNDPGVSGAVHMSWDRRYERGDASGDPDYRIFERVGADMPKLIEHLALAVETTPERDKRRDEALQGLVTGLALIWCDAAGEGMAYPSWNDAAECYNDPLDKFLDFLAVSTANLFLEGAPSGEVVRHRLRDAVELGEVPQKIAQPRLFQHPGSRIIDAVALDNEVTDDDFHKDPRPADRNHSLGSGRRAR